MRALTFVNYIIALIATMFVFSGCEIVGDIFKAGVWVGVVLVVAVIFLIIKLLSGGGGK